MSSNINDYQFRKTLVKYMESSGGIDLSNIDIENFDSVQRGKLIRAIVGYIILTNGEGLEKLKG